MSVRRLVTIALLAMVCLSSRSMAQTYGESTPEACLITFDQAINADDAATAATVMVPATRRQLVLDILQEITADLVVANPENPSGMGGMLPGATPDAKRASYASAVQAARHTLEPFSLDAALSMNPELIAKDLSIGAALDRFDTVQIIGRLFPLLSDLGAKLFDADPCDSPLHAITVGAVPEITVRGDEAGGTSITGTPVRFHRIVGRWYIDHALIWWLPHTPRGF